MSATGLCRLQHSLFCLEPASAAGAVRTTESGLCLLRQRGPAAPREQVRRDSTQKNLNLFVWSSPSLP